MNIYEKMSAITTEIMAVAKNLNVGWGKNQYKAVGEADVLATVKPIEAKYGVYSYPVSRNVIESGVLSSTKSDGSESKQLYLRIETVYRFVNTEKPDEFIDITTYGDGVDPQDKAPGKAMTYGDKYALLKAYKIITGEDPDQYLSNPLKDKKTSKPVAVTEESATGTDPDEKINEQHWKALATQIKAFGLSQKAVLAYFGIEKPSDITYQTEHDIIVMLPELAEEAKKKDA